MSTSSLGLAVAVIVSAFIILAAVSCVLRILFSRIRGRKLRIHDYLILTAMIFALAQYSSIWPMVFQGQLGDHIVQLDSNHISALFKSFTAHNIAWILATNLSKLSVLFLYFDIFSIRASFRRLTYGFMGFVIAYGISSLLCLFTICRPFTATWDRTVPGKCGNLMSAMFATAVINTVEDLIVVLMPMPILWNLQISSQKKVGMSAVIGVGLIICAINIARLSLASVSMQSDLSHGLVYQVLFMNLEVQVGIVTACLPTIKPLFSRGSPHSKPIYSDSEDTRDTTGSEKGTRDSRENQALTPDDDRYYGGKI